MTLVTYEWFPASLFLTSPFLPGEIRAHWYVIYHWLLQVTALPGEASAATICENLDTVFPRWVYSVGRLIIFMTTVGWYWMLMPSLPVMSRTNTMPWYDVPRTHTFDRPDQLHLQKMLEPKWIRQERLLQMCVHVHVNVYIACDAYSIHLTSTLLYTTTGSYFCQQVFRIHLCGYSNSRQFCVT